MFLAPRTAAITTNRHCQFGHICPRTISDRKDNGIDGTYGTAETVGISTHPEQPAVVFVVETRPQQKISKMLQMSGRQRLLGRPKHQKLLNELRKSKADMVHRQNL